MSEFEGIPDSIVKYWESHPGSIWLYNPNFPLAVVASVLYAIPMAILFYQTIFKYKSYYFIVVFFGALLEVAGYAIRAVSIKNYDTIVRLPPLFYRGFLFRLAIQAQNSLELTVSSHPTQLPRHS